MTPTLRIATRRSALALWQAEHVAGQLRAAHPQLQVELLPMLTQGDRVLDRALAEVGGKGLFVKELELALQEQRADLAVHSMKDVPSRLTPDFCIAASLPRADPQDAFVSRRHASFDALPVGAVIGTSSPRRQAQLRSRRPDLRLELLRGNVDTRLKRLDEGRYDAILLACAGLLRLGLGARITERLPIDWCVPAVGQGVIGIECRTEDTRSRALLAPLNDAVTDACLRAERAYAQALDGDCHAPIAAHARIAGASVHLVGFVGAPPGMDALHDEAHGTAAAPEALGRVLAERMLARGADRLLMLMRGGGAGP